MRCAYVRAGNYPMMTIWLSRENGFGHMFMAGSPSNNRLWKCFTLGKVINSFHVPPPVHSHASQQVLLQHMSRNLRTTDIPVMVGFQFSQPQDDAFCLPNNKCALRSEDARFSQEFIPFLIYLAIFHPCTSSSNLAPKASTQPKPHSIHHTTSAHSPLSLLPESLHSILSTSTQRCILLCNFRHHQ